MDASEHFTGGAGGLLLRVVLALGAVVVALWLAGNLRSVDRGDDASLAMAHAVTGGGHPAALDRADRMFQSARRFGADTHLKVEEAGIIGLVSPRRARPLVRQAIREEPDNVDAWVLAYGLSRGRRDPAGARARARVLALDPEAGPILKRVDAAR